MPRASKEDPLKAFRFKIVVDGFARAGFSEVGPFSKKTEVIKYREGGSNEVAQKSAGLSEYDPISCKRGLVIGGSAGGSDDFLLWAESVNSVTVQGNAENYRRDLDIHLFNAVNVLARVNRVYECWPSEYVSNSELKGLGNEDHVEVLKLENEGWEIITKA